MATATTTTEYFPVIVEEESNGTFSAYVAGLPGVYAAADTPGQAKRAIREAAKAHLAVLEQTRRPLPQPKMQLHVLRYKHARQLDANVLNVKTVGKKTFRKQIAAVTEAKLSLEYTGVGSLLGRSRSTAKARAARQNGRKGGRPRSTHHP